MTSNITCGQPEFSCNDIGILLPFVNESIWSTGFRGFLYLVGLLWSFMAIALVADAFMCAIEVITSQTTEITVARPDKEEGYEIIQVRIWNDTVANLTLMALGSSAPEILLSIIEILGNNFYAGKLGPGTIVGSASFNLLVIIAVCVVGIPNDQFRRIRRMKVFATTAFFQLFAYVWLYIVLLVSSPNQIEIWEATTTFAFFPILVILAFMADKNYCGKNEVEDSEAEIELGSVGEEGAALTTHSPNEDEKLKDVVQHFMKSLDKPERLSEEDAANIAAIKIQEQSNHSRAWYRVKASRDLLGGQKVTPRVTSNLQKALLGGSRTQLTELVSFENGIHDSAPRLNVEGIVGGRALSTTIEFDAVSCSVMENCGSVKVAVVRSGDTSREAQVRYETVDGTANATEDYIAVEGILKFKAREFRKVIEIEIIDDNVWEPDETFFVKLSLPQSNDYVKLGKKTINQITIINDDEPGTIEFTKPSYLVKESIGTAYFPLQRTNGADGSIMVEWEAKDLSAREGVHYRGKEGKVLFEHGEDQKNVEIEIINDHVSKKDLNFQVSITSASGGAQLGHTQKTVVTVVGDDEFDSLVRRVVAKTHLKLMKLKLGTQTWSEQFVNAMNVNGGDMETATAGDYVMHFLTFGFKVIVAFIPPPNLYKGWACFVGALVVLIGLTAIVGDLAGIFGCLIGLDPSVTAITLVALGTSLPDLFASKTAALHEKYADNSIGNVTGSNSVNVFLGLGLPWLMASIYWHIKTGQPFDVEARSLGFSVALYSISAILCILTLVARRYIKALGGSELGGPYVPKLATGIFFCLLWLVYIILSALQAYDVIAGF